MYCCLMAITSFEVMSEQEPSNYWFHIRGLDVVKPIDGRQFLAGLQPKRIHILLHFRMANKNEGGRLKIVVGL